MKKIDFIRFGGLSSVKQKGYDSTMPTFHSPPARKGIYAFVYGHIEMFLLSAGTLVSDRQVWIRDTEGNKISVDDIDWDDESNGYQGNSYWSTNVKRGKRSYYKNNREKDGSVSSGRTKESKENKFFISRLLSPKIFNHTGEIWHHLSNRVKNHEIISRKGEWVLSVYASYAKALNRELVNMKSYKEVHGIGFSKDHLEIFIERVS